MNLVDIYNRLIYRDLIGYCIPGSVCVILIGIAILGHEIIFGKLQELDFIEAIILLMVGGLVSHIFAVIIWYLPKRGELTHSDLTKMFAKITSGCLSEFYQKGFKEKIGSSPQKYKIEDQFVLAYSWLNANDMRTEIINRYESLANLFEVARISIPFSVLTLLFQPYFYNNYLHVFLVIASAILTFLVCHFGFKQMLYREATQIMHTFIRHSLRGNE